MEMRRVSFFSCSLVCCCCCCCGVFFLILFFGSEGVVVPLWAHTHRLGNMQIRIVGPEKWGCAHTAANVGWLMAGCCTTYFFSFFRFSLLRVDFVILFSSSPFHRHKSTGDIHFVLCFPPSLFLNSSLYLLLDDLNVKSEGKKNKIKTKYEKGKGKEKKWTSSENGARKSVLPICSPGSSPITPTRKIRNKKRPPNAIHNGDVFNTIVL